MNVRKRPEFKLTTPRNWLEPDVTMPVPQAEWLEYVSGAPLHERVPQDVWEAYTFAVGAVGYAYFYSPLFTMVCQQVLRVADFAIDRLFEALGKRNVRSFARRLEILHEEGYLSDSEFNRWDGIRRLRNSATHPAWLENWGEAMSLQTIGTVSLAISALPWPERKPRKVS